MYQFSILLLLLLGCNAPNNTSSMLSNENTQNEILPSTEILDMWIHHFKSPCVGEGDPRLCLQAQFGEKINEENWEFFYDAIEGFDGYELGNVYHLKVSQKTVNNPMADASSFSYHLEELVSKEPVSPETTFTLFLKQEGVPAYIEKDEATGAYLLANELEVQIKASETSKALDKLLADDTPFNGVFKHSTGRETIVLVDLK